jgi:hypothetical protein
MGNGKPWLQIFSIGTGQEKARKLFKLAADINIMQLAAKLISVSIQGANAQPLFAGERCKDRSA